MSDIDELLTRGVANVIPGKEELKKVLTSDSGKKLNIYMGIDPTSAKIHLGHTVLLRKLKAFADLGHNVTFLIGDFTALVGDTSDKDSERPILTTEQIEENFKTYKEQAQKILDFSKIKIAHNSEWLKKLTYEEILKLKQNFSLNDFISRDLIKTRLTDGKNVGLVETEYPIMQGYDSYFMDTDLQLGGADQTFNMQAGRTLQKKSRDKESFILAVSYLPGTDGRKMSKTWGNAIWLEDSAQDMYGKVMSVKDDLIIEYFTLATNASDETITNMQKRLSKGENPITIKKELALEITKEFYPEEAEDAQAVFEGTVQRHEIPTNVPEFETLPSATITDILVDAGAVESRSEAKRLIEQGGVEVDGKKFRVGTSFKVANNIIIKAGKHTYIKVKVS